MFAKFLRYCRSRFSESLQNHHPYLPIFLYSNTLNQNNPVSVVNEEKRLSKKPNLINNIISVINRRFNLKKNETITELPRQFN